MYYSLFAAHTHGPDKADARVPLIIWLQGGPGASSQLGAFTENGPIKITKDTIKEAGQPWNIIGHVLYIDQPLNVGFSYNRDNAKGDIGTAKQAADHLLNFLSNFYRTWPATRQSPLYITGESFAGHYIPAFGSKLVGNTTFITENNITLGGLAIGDGWTDPKSQINQYDSYLYSVGIVSNKFRDTCTWFQTQAIQRIMLGFTKNTRKQYWGGMSTYNFRQYGDGDKTFATFLQNNKGKLGVPDHVNFIAGNDDVYNNFAYDITRSYVGDVINLLKERVRIMIYNGQDDFVVNTPGVLNYLNNLNWKEIPMWKRTPKKIWTMNGAVKGWVKVYRNLWFVLVNHAGHMVPTDQP